MQFIAFAVVFLFSGVKHCKYKLLFYLNDCIVAAVFLIIIIVAAIIIIIQRTIFMELSLLHSL